MGTKSEAITKPRLSEKTVGRFPVNGKPHGCLTAGNERYIWVVILMFGEKDGEFMPIGKRKHPWEKVNFEDFRDNFGVE
jgi:hypothetical protein